MNKKLRSMASPLFVAGLLMSGVAAGCGGGGNDNGATVRDANGFVTRSEEGDYSVDALVLAAREAPDTAIPAATARAIDADLAAIRTRYPRLGSIAARPLDDLKSVIVTARTVSPVAAAWGQGDKVTSIPAIDTVLTSYKTESVSRLGTGPTDSSFVLRFTDPLNTRRVRETLATLASPDVTGLVSAQTNGMIGDGNQITRSGGGTGRVYTFSEAWGDCFAGCINRHKWAVTIGEGGALSLEESGSPLRDE